MDTPSAFRIIAAETEEEMLAKIRSTARQVVSAGSFSWIDLFLRQTVLAGAEYQRRSLPRSLRRLGAIDMRTSEVEYFVRRRASQILDVPGLVADAEEVSLTLRPRLVASTQVNAALFFGRHELLRQMVERGLLRRDQILRRWVTRSDEKVRNSHAGLHNQVRVWGDPFVSTFSGSILMHPHDPLAPAAEVVNCRCSEVITVNL